MRKRIEQNNKVDLGVETHPARMDGRVPYHAPTLVVDKLALITHGGTPGDGDSGDVPEDPQQ